MLTAQQAADALGVTYASLSVTRSRGTGCPFYKQGNVVAYDPRDIEAHRTLGPERGTAPRRMFAIKVYRAGALVGIQYRAAESLQKAAERLRLYPSFAGCTFKEVLEADIQPGERERLFIEFDRHTPQMREAFLNAVNGPTANARQAGTNAAKRIFRQIVKEALK